MCWNNNGYSECDPEEKDKSGRFNDNYCYDEDVDGY